MYWWTIKCQRKNEAVILTFSSLLVFGIAYQFCCSILTLIHFNDQKLSSWTKYELGEREDEKLNLHEGGVAKSKANFGYQHEPQQNSQT